MGFKGEHHGDTRGKMQSSSGNADGGGSDVHPIELTVQALLESPLETLNLNLKSLYESQMILHTILYKMENTLVETANNLRPGSFPLEDQVIPGGEGCDTCSSETASNDVFNSSEIDKDEISEDGIRIDHSDLDGELDLKIYLDKMNRIRRKLKAIEKVIDEIESRVYKIEHNLKIG